MLDLIGLAVGAALTLFALSYMLGDNPLYRLALHLFVGALVGYSFGILLREVFLLKVLDQLAAQRYGILVPVILGILLLIKGLPKYAYMGNFSIAYLVGVGTAVALSGALLGTLAPQVRATGRALSPAALGTFRLGLVDGVMIVLGTVCTLLSFTFAKPERQGVIGIWGRIVDGATWLGRIFLIVAFGVAFAGALTASLSIFIGRVQYLIDFVFRVIGF